MLLRRTTVVRLLEHPHADWKYPAWCRKLPHSSGVKHSMSGLTAFRTASTVRTARARCIAFRLAQAI
jgi:hypothetical protein